MIDFKGSHFTRDIILCGVRWYVAYPISCRRLEEMMSERGDEVDHPGLRRWVPKNTPLLDQAFRQRRRPVSAGWQMEETYVSVKGQWKYFYRAVDKAGDTVDFLLTAKRDRKSASRFLRMAIAQYGTLEKITIDKSSDNMGRSKATMQHMKPASKSAKPSISIILSGRTTERSNE